MGVVEEPKVDLAGHAAEAFGAWRGVGRGVLRLGHVGALVRPGVVRRGVAGLHVGDRAVGRRHAVARVRVAVTAAAAVVAGEGEQRDGE